MKRPPGSSAFARFEIAELGSLWKRFEGLKSTAEEQRELFNGRRSSEWSIEKSKFYTNCFINSACIKYRTNLSIEAIKKDFMKSQEEMGRGRERGGKLEVFGVSANIYLRYISDEARMEGFRTPQDTQLPSLRDWLIGTTFAARESYALAFLHEVENFVTFIQPWINDKYGDTKMSSAMRELRKPEADCEVSKLEEVCSITTGTFISLTLPQGVF